MITTTITMLSHLNGTPHPYRLELIGATEAETGQYVDLHLADYGPEGLVPDGVLLLNEDLRGGIRGNSEVVGSSDRFLFTMGAI